MRGSPAAVMTAALAAGRAELAGMTGGAWLSGEPKLAALANGGASFLICVLPVTPYLLWHGHTALYASLGLVLAVAGVIAWGREERGFTAILRTFGVLAVAAALCLIPL